MWFGYNPQINLSLFFLQFELSHFSSILTMKVNGQWVPCVLNSSDSFILILLKLYRCLYQALKICMWFGYDTQIKFYAPNFEEVEGAYWFGSVQSSGVQSVMRE